MGQTHGLAEMSTIRFQPEPQKREVKPQFEDLPADLITKIENVIGDKITGAEMAWGGYSASFSILADTEQSGRYFIKGSHPEEMAHGFKMLQQEIQAYQNIPILKTLAPPFVGYVAKGGEDDWHLGIWRAVEGGQIKTRWSDRDLQTVGQRMAYIYKNFEEQNENLLPAEETNFIQDILSGKNGWQRLDKNAERIENFCRAFHDGDAARAWLAANLDHLIDLSSGHADGHLRTLLHFDLRTDNMLFDHQDQVWLIDWPNACSGPAVYDLVYLAGELALRGNGQAGDIYQKLIGYSGLSVRKGDVKIALCQLTGYLALNFYRDVPEKLPRLRWLQGGMLFALTDWMNHLDICDSLPDPCQ